MRVQLGEMFWRVIIAMLAFTAGMLSMDFVQTQNTSKTVTRQMLISNDCPHSYCLHRNGNSLRNLQPGSAEARLP